MGQRPHPMVLEIPKDDRDCIVLFCSPKDVRGQPVLPSGRPGFREERIGSQISHHLRTSAEYIIVSSPLMTCQGVGGVIVLGGRESRLHGEGRQLDGISTQNNRMSTGMKFP
jgi:hypothetical protein